ncbi:unnamed protein product, partial [Didymodactylos carnosus]
MFVQKYNVRFVKDLNVQPVQKSGNPGYQQGLPILAGQCINGSNITLSTFSFIKAEKSGLCGTNGIPIKFGENVHSTCQLHVNDTSMCEDVSLSAYWPNILDEFELYIGRYGNSLETNVTRDKFVVDSALKIILNYIETLLPNVEEINYFSDGAASQFKQGFYFRNLARIAKEREINLSWHFFATFHGKCIVDEIGGTVRRLVWSAILAGRVCRSAEDFITLAKKKTKKIILIEVTRNDIDSSETKLENLFRMVKSVPETLKMHSVK